MSRWPPSAFALVTANLVPAFGVLFLDWSLFPMVLVYWCELVLIGAMSLLRMLFAYPATPGSLIAKAILLPFLPLFLGPHLFLVVFLGLIAFGFSGNRDASMAYQSIVFAASDWKNLLPLDESLRIFWREIDAGMVVAVAGLAASHLYSFIRNYILRGECNRATFMSLLIWPIMRTWLMLGAVCLGVFAMWRTGIQPPGLLVLVICAKTVLDLYSHLREHRATPAAR